MQAEPRDRQTDLGVLPKIIHDLGNPLAALSMQAQLILRRAARNEPIATVVEPAQCILATLDRLHALVAEVSSLARAQRLDLRLVSVLQFLQSLVELWTPLTTSRTIDFRLEIPEPVPPVRADVQQLRRVFDNLIKNAVEAIEPGPGRITLRASVPATGAIRLSVEDTGSGIAGGLDVFNPFETTKTGGTGLGLAVAKQIVLAHGGTIAHETVIPRGTVFHVDLPQRARRARP